MNLEVFMKRADVNGLLATVTGSIACFLVVMSLVFAVANAARANGSTTTTTVPPCGGTAVCATGACAPNGLLICPNVANECSQNVNAACSGCGCVDPKPPTSGKCDCK